MKMAEKICKVNKKKMMGKNMIMLTYVTRLATKRIKPYSWKCLSKLGQFLVAKKDSDKEMKSFWWPRRIVTKK